MFPIKVHTRHAGLATLVAALTTLSLAASTLAGSYSDGLTLRTAPDSVDLSIEDMASKGDDLAVAWQEDRPPGPASFMRLSDDGGQTYGQRLRLGGDDSLVRDPSVDVCDGRAFAISATAPVDHPNRWDVGLAYARIGGGGRNLDDRFLGFDDETHARRPDIACVGNRALAGAWLDDSTSPARVELLVREIEFCGDKCTGPGFWNRYDLGAARVSGGVSVAATNHDVYVAWMRNEELRFKRFELGAPGVIDPHPTVTILEIAGAGGSPMLAATDENVVLIYYEKNDARVRISHDHGASFGPHKTYVDGPTVGEAFAFPTSVDARGSRILLVGMDVGFQVGPGGYIADAIAWSVESVDGGTHWTRERHNIRGNQVGVLTDGAGADQVAEAWDQFWARYSSEPVSREKLRSRYELP